MAIHQLSRQQLIRKPIEDAWRFFSNPHNLKIITPQYMNFKVLTNDLPQEIYPGLLISYKVSPVFHIPLSWVTAITVVRKNEFFIDEQRTGPYKLWRHQHHFQQTENGVLMTDTVDYQLPFSIIGELANFTFVKSQLEGIFEYRRQQVERIFND